MCDEDTLKDKTETYWNKFDQGANVWIPWYIDNLLALELDYAIKSGRIKPETLTGIRPLTLVQLVGYSIEPLLQTICVYKPDHIVFIVSPKYYSLQKNSGVYNPLAGKQFVEKFVKGYLSQLQQQNLIENQPECNIRQLSAVTPSAVFQTLLSTLKTHGQGSIVVDVTGGKKSMITGAYLYAAFDRNARLSYVDSDDTLYDRDRGRPYGYGCQIDKLDNPYQDFALRNWEQLRSLYKHYNFRAARELLIGPDGNKGEGTLWKTAERYLPELCAAIDKLADVLEFYRFWDDGDYGAAYTRKDQLAIAKEKLPSAVLLLGSDWFRFTRAQFTPAQHFFDDDDRLRAYVHDELARIKRLIDYNEDWRSAFLKAGGLNEVLMLARLVRQIADQSRKEDLLSHLREEKTPNISWVMKKMAQTATFTDQDTGIQFRGSGMSWHTRREIQFPAMSVGRTLNTGWERFLNLRNKIAHTYISVPKELAEDGLAFVQANFDDFRKNAPDIQQFQVDTVSWSNLCKACELEQWLHPTLCAD